MRACLAPVHLQPPCWRKPLFACQEHSSEMLNWRYGIGCANISQCMKILDKSWTIGKSCARRNAILLYNLYLFKNSFLTLITFINTWYHYNDVKMGAIASQITSLTIVYSIVYSDADQRKHQSSASLASVRSPVNSPHKWSVTRKMFPFDDVIMNTNFVMY